MTFYTIWGIVGLVLVGFYVRQRFLLWRNNVKCKVFDPDTIERWLK